jgi:pSer/pThr/pTyr-binding forkhead associated (FHA) protein
MLEQPGGFPKTLEPGKRFTFGRSSDCDLTIPSQRVSREHAELTWTEQTAFIKDLGSQNGTQVNGRPAVQAVELKDGDEITIGPYTCTYRAQSGVGSVAKVDRSAASANTVADMADSLAGNLEQMSLWELLDSLEHNEKTGTLEVFHPEGDAAKLVLKEGWPIHATLEGQSGRDAVYALLAWDEGLFRFEGGEPEEEPNLERVTINALLHEANERLGG